ncbi:MAG: response regulator [Bdellovibrionales bacterium]|nr:response regulator [Bdellovibrionales bacterium]
MEKRALIVDDDPTIRNLVQAILEDDGFEVNTAENGKLALEFLSSRAADIELVVLDVMMPEMNGLETLAAMKEQESTADLPVLMLTAEDQPDDILAGYSVGADYYITKPFTRQQLLYGVNLVLGLSEEEE